MSFLKPGFGRNGHADAAPVETAIPVEAAPPSPAKLPDAHARVIGVLSAELDRLADAYGDALQETEARLARALAENESLRRRHGELEREFAESQRRVRALKHLLDE